MSALAWMAWTQPVAIFFACIGLLLIAMTLWELRSPTVARKGLLPLVTTRGDRLFIGLLTAAYINLAWTGLTDCYAMVRRGARRRGHGGYHALGLTSVETDSRPRAQRSQASLRPVQSPTANRRTRII